MQIKILKTDEGFCKAYMGEGPTKEQAHYDSLSGLEKLEFKINKLLSLNEGWEMHGNIETIHHGYNLISCCHHNEYRQVMRRN